MMIDVERKLSMDTATFVGRSVAVLGITGSGKTNTAAVLIEELLSSGLPLTIVDIEGEYYGLKERYELLVAGRSEHAELEIGPENAAQLAEVSLQRGISVILDLSDYTQDEQYEFLVEYFRQLWEVAGKERKPYQIILEEAHEWVPQGANTPLKQMLTRIALRGRKRGLGIILMSQRSAKVEKDVLTQTSLLFLHKVVHPTDMKVYKDLIPLLGPEVEQIVGSLLPGQAVIVSNYIPQVVCIRLRYTFHAGATPEFGTSTQPELRRIDATLLQELQQLLATKDAPKDDRRLERRIKELEAMVASRDAEIVRLKAQPVVTVVEPVQVEQKKVIPPPLNERKFASFANRIASLSKRQRLLLQLLTDKDQWMNVQHIAAWMNIEEESFSKNPPMDLLRLRLIERERYNDGFHYRSVLRSYLPLEFPGADVDVLIRRLFG